MSHFWDLSKQYRPRSNAASDQGLHCLLTGISIQNRIKMKKYTRHPKIRNGLVQLIRMEKPIRQIWGEVLFGLYGAVNNIAVLSGWGKDRIDKRKDKIIDEKLTYICLNSVSSQCARGKPSIRRKPQKTCQNF